MVRKEELCQWFKNLKPHKRIDYMCGMLHSCLPMELRFISSVLEDLCKKDFNHLRECETKANSKAELSNFFEKDENAFRTKMATYLSLLQSSNRTCSHILCSLLESNLTNAFAVQKSQDELTVYNILLVLVMAVNHPAFTFTQKVKLYESYERAEKNAEDVVGKDQDGFPSFNVPESANGNSYDQHLPSPALSPKSVKLASPVHSNKVHITNIEVKGSVKKSSGEKRHEYKLQVTWSNGEVTEVSKTYQELHDFHNELMKHFSEEANRPKQDRKLPFFQGPVPPKDENSQIVSYIRSLLTCPKHILEWDFLSQFFHGVISSNNLDVSTLPQSHSISQPNSQQSNSGDDDESVITCYPAKSLTIYNSQLNRSGEPEILSQRSHLGNSIVGDVVPRFLPVVHSLGQSPVSSPTNSRSESPATQSSEGQLLSHQQKLPVFQEQLIITSAEEDSADKRSLGKSRLAMELSPAKDKIFTLPNGVMDHTVSGATINPTAPMTLQHFPYPPPPYYIGPHGAPPFSSYPPYYYLFCPPSPNSGTRDSSPTNSDSYSPTPSPFPNVKALRKSQMDSSSDDNDKDSLNSQDNLRSVAKRKSVPTQISGQMNSVEIPIEDGHISPLSHSHKVLDMKDGVSMTPLAIPVCGYSSDPGFVQPYPQIIHTQYKAQPAHTNIPIHAQNIVSMPVENATVKVANPFVPVIISKHHVRDVTMTTTVITASVNAMTSQNTLNATATCETSMRQMYYYPVFNRPVYSNGNRPTFCTANRFGEPISQSSSKVNVHFPSPGPVNNSQSNKNGPGITSSLQAPQGNSNIANECSLLTQPHSYMDNATHATMSMQNAPPTYTTSAVTYTTVSSVTPSQSPSANQPICSSCGCTGHPPPVPISYPYLSSMQAIPPTQYHQYPNVSTTSNGLIPAPMPYFTPTHIQNGYSPEVLYSGSHQSVYSIAQPIPTSVPSVPGYIYGYTHSLNSQQNANHNGGNAGTRPKKISCYNCGSSKHLATECPETTMDGMLATFRLKYRKTEDSE
ncbi:hypothetical protein CHS0354_026948 [Potamilus streckersoni]|uniref:CCHC-type domain-containing protein n=1 Tax=Potamilus streckersoni TaxID=2493646 RepID=A0AAE0SCD8_9BIVA|nr:hypothetical protein CHS0354_026948 [Potamilus streckersoni]